MLYMFQRVVQACVRGLFHERVHLLLEVHVHHRFLYMYML